MEQNNDLSEKIKFAQKLLSEIGNEAEKRVNYVVEKEKAWNELQKKLEENWNKQKQKIKLDVGGKIFTTSKDTLLKFKDTYFSALLGSGNWRPDEDGTIICFLTIKELTLLTETQLSSIELLIICEQEN